MRLEIVTKGFPRSEATQQFLEESALHLIETFLDNEKDLKFRVSVDEDRHRMQNRKPHYTCEILIKSHDSKKIFKTHGAGEDFHQTCIEAFLSMKRVLAKKSSRMRGPDHEFMAGA